MIGLIVTCSAMCDCYLWRPAFSEKKNEDLGETKVQGGRMGGTARGQTDVKM